MAKFASEQVLDALLDEVATATRLTVCDGQPTNFADISNVALAEETLTSGDFSKSAGDVSGRKITIATQEDLAIDTSGTADHIALDDGTTLLYVTTVSSPQSLSQGGTVTVASWDVEVQDPS